MPSYRFFGPDINATGNFPEFQGTATAVGDFDGDGRTDFVFGGGADQGLGLGAQVYLVTAAALEAADAADGTTDFTINLDNVAGLAGSFQLSNFAFGSQSDFGAALATGDYNGDGQTDLLIGAGDANIGASNDDTGAAFLFDGSDLAAMDAADGTVDGRIDAANATYTFVGDETGGGLGTVVGTLEAEAAGIDQDDDLVIAAPFTDSPGDIDEGSLWVISFDDLARLDGLDGTVDGRIELTDAATNANPFFNTNHYEGDGGSDRFGTDFAYVGEVLPNSGGLGQFLVGGDGASGGTGVVYLVTATAPQVADQLDGTTDGFVDVENLGGAGGGFVFTGAGTPVEENLGQGLGFVTDINGDGLNEIIISGTSSDVGGSNAGVAYLLFSNAFDAADRLDGQDNSIDLTRVAGLEISEEIVAYRLIGDQSFAELGLDVAAVGDANGDGRGDFLISAPGGNSDAGTYLVTSAALEFADGIDGSTDGNIFMRNLVGVEGSYLISSNLSSDVGTSVQGVGDVDGDGIVDFLIGNPTLTDPNPNAFQQRGGGYLLSGADLRTLDALDGMQDGNINLDTFGDVTTAVAVNGSNGSERIVGRNGNDTLQGLDGDDRIEGGLGNDEILGGNGNDIVAGGLGADLIFGGSGADTVNANEGADTVFGGNGRDLVFLNQGNDVFNDNGQGGDTGRDTVFGGLGDDTLNGGNGRDALFGDDGFDVIFGGLGADALFGGNQADTITAGQGNDTVGGGNGRDLVNLGEGNDVFNDNTQGGVAGQDTVFGGGGNDSINGGGGNDQFFGGTGNDTILARLGDDSVFGGGGFDLIFAAGGNDEVIGGNGQDTVDLGAGDDLFIDTDQGGDLGRDTITGGAGADTFQFGALISTETITDFELGTDMLRLSSTLTGGLSAAQVAAAADATADGVLLSFGAGQSVLLEGLMSTAGLADDIIVF